MTGEPVATGEPVTTGEPVATEVRHSTETRGETKEREGWREEGEEEKRGGRWTRVTERRPHPWNPSCWLLKKKGPLDDCKTTRGAKV